MNLFLLRIAEFCNVRFKTERWKERERQEKQRQIYIKPWLFTRAPIIACVIKKVDVHIQSVFMLQIFTPKMIGCTIVLSHTFFILVQNVDFSCIFRFITLLIDHFPLNFDQNDQTKQHKTTGNQPNNSWIKLFVRFIRGDTFFYLVCKFNAGTFILPILFDQFRSASNRLNAILLIKIKYFANIHR